MTSLSLQEVDYYEPSNFYIGPRAVISAFNDRLANRFLIVGLLFFDPRFFAGGSYSFGC